VVVSRNNKPHSLSPLSFLHTSKKSYVALYETAYETADVYQCTCPGPTTAGEALEFYSVAENLLQKVSGTTGFLRWYALRGPELMAFALNLLQSCSKGIKEVR
jgi:hypothetical protein